MYAIVEIGGQQHKVKKAQKLYVNLLESEEGTNLEFDKVLLVDNGSDVTVGLPFVEGTRVSAKVMSHVKDDKIHIFKHKRRKGYRRFNGHRQPLTELFIHGILGKGETLKEDLAPKKIKKAPKAEAHVDETSAEAPKKKVAAKKKAAPKAEGKKPAAKKTTTKKKSKE
ncbi:MAG TPA: 50S ribosomal protein L21 [Bacteroidia bacterium]|jgi:large subunit ribosomal protein L21|nr:50S ribosomal protein L21 [Bacteroidia bacterium]